MKLSDFLQAALHWCCDDATSTPVICVHAKNRQPCALLSNLSPSPFGNALTLAPSAWAVCTVTAQILRIVGLCLAMTANPFCNSFHAMLLWYACVQDFFFWFVFLSVDMFLYTDILIKYFCLYLVVLCSYLCNGPWEYCIVSKEDARYKFALLFSRDHNANFIRLHSCTSFFKCGCCTCSWLTWLFCQ